MIRPIKHQDSDSELYEIKNQTEDAAKPFHLYVEGPIDKHFYEILKKRLNKDYFDFRELSGGPSNSPKKRIMNHIKINRKPGEYGVVDKDFDEPSCLMIDGLFFTDTHDLETLLFSKDQTLMLRIFNKFYLKDVEKSKYIAYQIGIIKKALYKIDRGVIELPQSIAYEEFASNDSGNKIHLEAFCKYMVANDQNTNIEFETLKNINIIQAYFSPDSFIFNRNSDDILAEKDLWDIINGHDLSIILRSVNKEIDDMLPRKKHGFEEKIVEKVNPQKFQENTKLYKQMEKVGLF